MRFESICPACGRSFKNSHVEMLAFCSVGCQIDEGTADRETLERSPLAPGEGTWSVFAEKVVRERDDARERCAVAEQRALDAECERDACRGMEQAAEMRAERLFRDRALVDDRARIAAQILIAEVGAEGPMNVDDVAKAAAIFIRGQSAHATRSMSKLAAVAKLLVANGCDCECGHDSEGHDDDCERCFACKVSDAIGSIDEGGSRAYERIP